MASSAKTKTQLMEENDKLRAAVKELTANLESSKQAKDGNFTNRMFVAFVDKNGKFKKVELAFNPHTGEASVNLDSAKPISNNDFNFPIAVFEAKKFLQDYMDTLCDEHANRK